MELAQQRKYFDKEGSGKQAPQYININCVVEAYNENLC